jgi:hypothetical protein
MTGKNDKIPYLCSQIHIVFTMITIDQQKELCKRVEALRRYL